MCPHTNVGKYRKLEILRCLGGHNLLTYPKYDLLRRAKSRYKFVTALPPVHIHKIGDSKYLTNTSNKLFDTTYFTGQVRASSLLQVPPYTYVILSEVRMISLDTVVEDGDHNTLTGVTLSPCWTQIHV